MNTTATAITVRHSLFRPEQLSRHYFSGQSLLMSCLSTVILNFKAISTARRIQPTIEPQRFRGIMKCFPRVIPYQASRWRF